MPNGERTEHESFGMIEIHRTQGGYPYLFGSSIPHNNKVSITIKHAEMERHLNSDHYYGRRQIVEIEMSPTQFAEAITNMNTSGVPCTIRYIEGKRMENCPFVGKREQFADEFEDKMRRIAKELDTLSELAQALTQTKAPNKDQKEAILKEVERIRMEIGDNLPFTYRMFNEQMDKTVLEAKGEFEAMVQHTITSLGLQALKAEDFRLLASGESTPTEKDTKKEA